MAPSVGSTRPVLPEKTVCFSVPRMRHDIDYVNQNLHKKRRLVPLTSENPAGATLAQAFERVNISAHLSLAHPRLGVKRTPLTVGVALSQPSFAA